jgi:hypothetical protein
MPWVDTLNHQLQTLNPKPNTHYPKPLTIISEPQTLDPIPSNLNPPLTLHPKLKHSALNPKRETLKQVDFTSTNASYPLIAQPFLSAKGVYPLPPTPTPNPLPPTPGTPAPFFLHPIPKPGTRSSKPAT